MADLLRSLLLYLLGQDTVSLTSPVEESDSELSRVSISPSVSDHVTNLKTETVYGSVNLVTRLRDTVLVFTSASSGDISVSFHPPLSRFLCSLVVFSPIKKNYFTMRALPLSLCSLTV